MNKDLPLAQGKIAFELGWDYAAYQAMVLPEGLPNEVAEGFKCGLARLRDKRKPPDRYIRKWLLLRANALRREREFNADVTPAYLRQIDSDYCPITFEKLTHSEIIDTDWSIDRVCNIAAYAQGNLAVMSVRANEAKDRMDFIEITKAAEMAKVSMQGTYRGLSEIEWRRMSALARGPATLTEGVAKDVIDAAAAVVPQCTWVPVDLVVATPQLVQYHLSLNIANKNTAFHKAYRKLGTAATRKKFDKLMERLERHTARLPKQVWKARGVSPYDAWLYPVVFNLFMDWFPEIQDEDIFQAIKSSPARKWSNLAAVDDGLLEEWSTASRGFVGNGK